VLKEAPQLSPCFHLLNAEGVVAFISIGFDALSAPGQPVKPGFYRVTCRIPGNFMAEGTFMAHAIVATVEDGKRPVTRVFEKEALSFQVVDEMKGDSVRRYHRGAYWGVVRPELRWEKEVESTRVTSDE